MKTTPTEAQALQNQLSALDKTTLVKSFIALKSESDYENQLMKELGDAYLYRLAELEVVENFMLFQLSDKVRRRFKEQSARLVNKRYFELLEIGGMPTLPALPVREDLYA